MRGFGGVLGVELAGDASDAGQFISHLKLARISASLGGTETLVVHPSSMWRGMLSDEQILDAGVKPGLVRIAAGLEDTDDLIDDVLSAADSVAKP
jgi:methionine-gamma-lyase